MGCELKVVSIFNYYYFFFHKRGRQILRSCCACLATHRRMLRNILSSQGMQSLMSGVNSYSSRALSSNALKSGCSRNDTLITYLLQSSPTYTTRWPFGTSLGISSSSSSQPPLKQSHLVHLQLPYVPLLLLSFLHL